jgi:hypothetical protein
VIAKFFPGSSWEQSEKMARTRRMVPQIISARALSADETLRRNRIARAGDVWLLGAR